MNFFNMLKNDHKEVKEIMKRIMEGGMDIDRELTAELCQKLLLHMELEEKYFYPIALDYDETGDLGKESELAHKEAKKFIRALQKNNLDDIEFKVKFDVLQAAIEHHIKEEEHELFPKAKEALSEDQIQEITQKMVALKGKKPAGVA